MEMMGPRFKSYPLTSTSKFNIEVALILFHTQYCYKKNCRRNIKIYNKGSLDLYDSTCDFFEDAAVKCDPNVTFLNATPR
jgi:hypothetical protein